MKTIYLFIGPKGSGKSYIGELIEEHFQIPFVRVEDWLLGISKGKSLDDQVYLKEVFEIIETGIRNELTQKDSLVFESTGLTAHFDLMLKSLKANFKVITIGIETNPELCLERIQSRDQSIHIQLPVDEIAKVNKVVTEKGMTTHYQVNNDNTGKEDLIRALGEIIGYTSA